MKAFLAGKIQFDSERWGTNQFLTTQPSELRNSSFQCAWEEIVKY
jgi:hypothetical protein